MQNLIFTNQVQAAVEQSTARGNHNMTVWIADANTANFLPESAVNVITIPDGDAAKSLPTVCRVWDEMQRLGVTRHSLVINLGGGMVTDLGGFAAATKTKSVLLLPPATSSSRRATSTPSPRAR